MKIIKKCSMIRRLNSLCKKARSQRKWALANGVSPQHVTDFKKGRRRPNYALLNALGYNSAAKFGFVFASGRFTREDFEKMKKRIRKRQNPFIDCNFEDV